MLIAFLSQWDNPFPQHTLCTKQKVTDYVYMLIKTSLFLQNMHLLFTKSPLLIVKKKKPPKLKQLFSEIKFTTCNCKYIISLIVNLEI